MNRDRENLKRLIKQFGFGDVEDYLLQHSRPSIRVETTPVSDESELSLGQSKIGGRPDLPGGIDWVRISQSSDDVSLPFIAQFALSDVKAHDVENLLPEHGMLYFFADPWRGSFSDHGKVIFYDGDLSTLERCEFPDDLPPTPPHEWGVDRFEPCSVKFISELNLDFDMPNFDYPDGKNWEDFYELVYVSSYTRPNPPFVRDVNRLLGVPYDVPRDMQLDCQLMEDTGSYYNRSTEEREAAKSTKAQWQLLFQMSSDENANMAWSDMGTICYYIRKQDLQAEDFSRVCMTFFTP